MKREEIRDVQSTQIMTIICNIQRLEKIIDCLQPHSFETLWGLQYQQLQEIQNALIIDYNKIIEGKKFARDMIYRKDSKQIQ